MNDALKSTEFRHGLRALRDKRTPNFLETSDLNGEV
jgi:hypothetical protein